MDSTAVRLYANKKRKSSWDLQTNYATFSGLKIIPRLVFPFITTTSG